MKVTRRIVGVLAFTLIFVSIFVVCDRVLMRKSTEGWWNVTEKIDTFYNSPENEYDVMFFGSSNAYCSFNPLEIWNMTGVKSYVFATQQQPVWASYHYMVDAFKTQSPDVAVLDVLMMSKNEEYYDDGVNYTFCDNMPLSKNKIELVFASAPKGGRFNLLCKFMKYHSRWNDLNGNDFTYRKADMDDYSKGFYVLTDTYMGGNHTDTSNVTEEAELLGKNSEYLYKIIDLCREKNVELILVKAPSNSTPEEKMYYNAVEKIAENEGITFIDYNEQYEKIGLDLSHDFFDSTHLNIWGAQKFSGYFVETVDYFEGKERNDDSWQPEFERYMETVSNS